MATGAPTLNTVAERAAVHDHVAARLGGGSSAALHLLAPVAAFALLAGALLAVLGGWWRTVSCAGFDGTGSVIEPCARAGRVVLAQRSMGFGSGRSLLWGRPRGSGVAGGRVRRRR